MIGRKGVKTTEITRRNNSVRENLLFERHLGVEKVYKIIDVIGRGSISTISIAYKKKNLSLQNAAGGGCFQLPLLCSFPKKNDLKYYDEDTRMVAIKTIDLKKVGKENLIELRNEINILRTLDHPNIARAFESFESRSGFALVLELCTGDLFSRSPYSENDAITIIKQLLSAVSYMHERNIIHRDIKYENIMFESGRKESVVKLIDFGLSAKYLKKDCTFTKTVGTIYTMSPEVLIGSYTSKADMWALGVVFHMLLTSIIPFWGDSREEVVEQIRDLEIDYNYPEWKFINRKAQELVGSMLDRNPETRIDAKEALDSKLFRMNNFSRSSSQLSEEARETRKICKSLENYAETSELKKLALKIIAHSARSEDITKLRDMFFKIDTDNSGYITSDEFKEALEKCDCGQNQEELFNTLMSKNGGVIRYTDFLGEHALFICVLNYLSLILDRSYNIYLHFFTKSCNS